MATAGAVEDADLSLELVARQTLHQEFELFLGAGVVVCRKDMKDAALHFLSFMSEGSRAATYGKLRYESM